MTPRRREGEERKGSNPNTDQRILTRADGFRAERSHILPPPPLRPWSLRRGFNPLYCLIASPQDGTPSLPNWQLLTLSRSLIATQSSSSPQSWEKRQSRPSNYCQALIARISQMVCGHSDLAATKSPRKIYNSEMKFACWL